MKFEELYNIYRDKVFRICMGYVNDHDWAKDIAQDTFITIWQALPKFRQEAAIGTWIFRITANNCLRQLERQHRMPRTTMPAELAESIEPDIEPQVRILYQCISQLPETDRLIISLELEDVKQAEIARIVGLGESNVRVRIHRIKERLAQKIKSHEY
jgi:RNA polymerase sigma-70 factor, ECF subfamily